MQQTTLKEKIERIFKECDKHRQRIKEASTVIQL